MGACCGIFFSVKDKQYIIYSKKNYFDGNLINVSTYNNNIENLNIINKTEVGDNDNSKHNNSYRVKGLKKHNYFRGLHGSPHLHLNHKLCDIADKYLKKLLEPDKIISSELYNGEILGENVFIYNCEKTFVEICELWYEENKKYNYNLNKFQIDTGHFSQMVWNKTKEVGFSFLFDEKKK